MSSGTKESFAMVNHADGADQLTIEVSYNGNAKRMNRSAQEGVGDTLARMRMTFNSQPRPKGKKVTRQEILSQCPPAVLEDGSGAAIPDDTPNLVAWRTATALRIAESVYAIRVNFPAVESLVPPKRIVCGEPTMVSDATMHFCEGIELEWAWVSAEGEVVGDSPVLVPTEALVGKQLEVRCRPRVEGGMWASARTPVVLPPGNTLPRCALTREAATAPAFRVVTYNVLHDAFATSDYAMNVLYAHVDPQFLDLDYRKGRVAKEIADYNGDIVCLQEVGQSVYASYYAAALKAMGYDSQFCLKTGRVTEGCCIAWRSGRYTVEQTVTTPLSYPTLTRDYHAALNEAVSKHEHLVEALAQVTGQALLIRLKDNATNKILTVATAHLFWHPNGCHIRALQAYMVLAELARMSIEFGPSEIVFAGDLNFTNTTGGYQLVATGEIPADSWSWSKGLKYWWTVDSGRSEGGEEATTEEASPKEGEGKKSPSPPSQQFLTGPPTSFFSQCIASPIGPMTDVFASDNLPWSNYTPGFKMTIDHVFVSKGLSAVRTIPIPEESELSMATAIPNQNFPSDHIALVADLTFGQQP